MLARHLLSVPDNRRDIPALIYGDFTATYGDLARVARELVARWRGIDGLRVGLAIEAPDEYLPAVIALASLRCHAFLAGRRDAETLDRLGSDLRWDITIHGLRDEVRTVRAGAIPDSDAGERVTLLTSGTTGDSKAVNHTWSTLAAPVRRDERYASSRWLCAYPLNLYAGTQLMLQALLNWATLVVPASLDPEVVARTICDRAVTHAGGTPTFWRQLLLFAPRAVLASCRLEQITMGGEPVNQGLLDQLSALFPGTRLVHIYASTELGRLFSVADRREGFPAQFLDQPPEPYLALRVIGDELYARSGNAMLGYDRGGPPSGEAVGGLAESGWIATGDIVERQGDRILFRGRKSDIINVGGRKVVPARVEAALRDVPGVADLRVYGKSSSVVGQIVAADIVLEAGQIPAEVTDNLNRAARDRLAPPEVPRLVRIVKAIAHTKALKVRRSE